MKKCRKWRFWIISRGWVLITNVLLLVINIVILCRCAPSSEKLDFDYYGVIVGVLSLLVAALIGWNIETALGIKKDVARIDRDINNIKNDINKIRTANKEESEKVREDSLNDCIRILATMEERLTEFCFKSHKKLRHKLFLQTIDHAVNSMDYWAKLGEYEEASKFVDVISKMEKYANEKKKKAILEKLKKMDGIQNIKGFELLFAIYS
jgi:hypothetical protein